MSTRMSLDLGLCGETRNPSRRRPRAIFRTTLRQRGGIAAICLRRFEVRVFLAVVGLAFAAEAVGYQSATVFGARTDNDQVDARRCLAVKSFHLNSGEIVASEWVQSPASLRGLVSEDVSTTAVPFCRVTAKLKPVSDSQIGVEVWLPRHSVWNGKFKGVGSAGLGGVIFYGDLVVGLKQGYATAATDTGHDNTGGPGRFALGHPEKIVDYGYRAIHEAAVAGKAITSAYYGKALRYTYFQGCSQGGQEALMEAQRYPRDYSGIISGDPDYYQTRHEVGAHLWVASTLYSDPRAQLSSAQAQLIGDAVNAACDKLDGVEDGVLEDPRHCHFDPGVLQCHEVGDRNCLTKPQVIAVRKLWSGPAGATFSGYYPGLERGGEASLWQGWIVASSVQKNIHAMLGFPFFEYFVFADPNWDFRTFKYEKAPEIDRRFASILNAVDADLLPFFSRGGKVIHYHGFSDPDVPPGVSILYYEKVAHTFRNRHVDLASFYRLFMVPGMGHCGGGPGANSFDMMLPLENWVERGVAPERIIATKYLNDDPKSNPVRTHPLCPYPKFARYSGHGSTDDARNFVCATNW